MTKSIQLAGIVAMTVLAAAILCLIGYVFTLLVDKVTPDGKVPVLEGGMFTALLLSFREVIGIIKSIWDHADRSELTAAVSNSTPIANPNPPVEVL